MDEIELNRKFGEAILPRYHTASEASIRPSSAQILNNDSSTVLSEYIELSKSNNSLVMITVKTGFMIWLVAEDGEIHFSFEEVRNVRCSELAYIRQRADKSTPHGNKLGHPSLVSAAAARIGGEIYYDEDLDCWMITNQSGRYGYNRPRAPELLQNVAEVFQRHGIVLQPFAI